MRHPLRRAGARTSLAAMLSAALMAGALPADEASAATTTFEPVRDAYVDAGHRKRHYGEASTLKADRVPARNAYLRFDVRGLTQPVTRATVKLRSATTTTTGISLRAVSRNGWSERKIDYANAPAYGPVASRSGPFSTRSWASLDATPLVEGNGPVSFAITTRSKASKRLSSREGKHPPRLVIETRNPPPPPPPPPPPDPVVAAAGDVACDPADSAYNGGLGTATRCRQKYVSDLLVGGDLSAVLPLGDLQYENAELAKFQQVFDPTWGRVKPLSRPIVGNHEYGTAGARGYFDYFNGIDSPDGPAGRRGQGYYSFDLSNWHLIALNSNCAEVGGCGEGSAQKQWLEADLAANSSKCTLAYWHHPRFTSSRRGDATDMGPIWRELYEASADVVLTGHAHGYERFARQDPDGVADRARGIRQFVVGTGGKDFHSFPDVAPNSGVRNNDTYGVLRLTLRPAGYGWSFVPETDGTFTDAGSDVCEGAVADASPPSAPSSLTAAATGSGEVSLGWDASSDNDGVSTYRVFRDGEPIGSASRTRYTDSAVQPGTTYGYEVVAVDPAGNPSGRSNVASVTTPSR